MYFIKTYIHRPTKCSTIFTRHFHFCCDFAHEQAIEAGVHVLNMFVYKLQQYLNKTQSKVKGAYILTIPIIHNYTYALAYNVLK